MVGDVARRPSVAAGWTCLFRNVCLPAPAGIMVELPPAGFATGVRSVMSFLAVLYHILDVTGSERRVAAALIGDRVILEKGTG